MKKEEVWPCKWCEARNARDADDKCEGLYSNLSADYEIIAIGVRCRACLAEGSKPKSVNHGSSCSML